MGEGRGAGMHQNTRRMTAVLDALAQNAEQGLRLIDVARETGLGKGTAHRILAGLVSCDLANQDPHSGRFFIGLRIMNWATAVRKRFGLAEQMKPVLQAISESTGETTYLTVRQGDDVIYVDRREGWQPLKALPVDVGARRPLGVGAAPLAILAFLADAEIERVAEAYSPDRNRFGIDEDKFRSLIERAKRLGYSLHDGEVLAGMVAVGVPIRDSDGTPFAAISVAAPAERLQPPRRDEIAVLIGQEIAKRRIAE